jgi:hypothetical protein
VMMIVLMNVVILILFIKMDIFFFIKKNKRINIIN